MIDPLTQKYLEVLNEGTDKGINTIPDNSVGHEQSEGRELLSQTAISDAGKDSSSTRKNSSSIRARLFGRRRNKK
jgi:hypothetical protein